MDNYTNITNNASAKEAQKIGQQIKNATPKEEPWHCKDNRADEKMGRLDVQSFM